MGSTTKPRLKRLTLPELTKLTSEPDPPALSRLARHCYCCVWRAMRRACTKSSRLEASHPEFVRISYRILEPSLALDHRAARANRGSGEASGRVTPNFERTSAEMGQRLNAFFAISVNSPSMSMVNFSCCVGLTPEQVRGVTRRVPPQPIRAAVRMKAGDHARL